MVSRRTISIGGVLLLVMAASAAAQSPLKQASLRNGDYGTGSVVNTFPPNHGGSPGVPGIVSGPDGTRFIATEVGGRSNALVNWQIGNNAGFRRTGTITFLFKAIRGQLSAGGGEIVCDNYGFAAFNNGQATFSITAGPLANGPGPADDRVRLQWNTWHNNVWHGHNAIDLEYDRWYSVGFAWGRTTTNFEVWVDQVLASTFDLPAGTTMPWGSDAFQSGFNMGLGDNHERGLSTYNSAAGVMFADIRIWNVYRALGDTVNPNTAPAAAADAYSTDEEQPLTVAAPGVLGNDTDAEDDTLTATLVATPDHGSVVLNADGSFTYTPASGYHGSDSFTYKASDGSLESSIVAVSLTINSVNDAPVAAADSATTAEDTPVSVDVGANDTDADGDPLTITHASTANGSIALDEDGLTFTPDADFHGTATILYSISDGQGGVADGVLTVTVTPVNDAPEAAPLNAETPYQTPLAIPLSASDADGDALTFAVSSPPDHGSISGEGASLIYTPNAGFSGPDGFAFSVSDGHGGFATALVYIVVGPAPPPPPPENRVPVAMDDTASVRDASDVTIAVIANDSDPDGDPLHVTMVSSPSIGTAVATPAGEIVYHANLVGSVSGALEGLSGLTQGQLRGLQNSLAAAAKHIAEGRANAAARLLEEIARRIRHFAGANPQAAALAAWLEALAAGGASDAFMYAVSDGNGGSSSATVQVTIRLQ